VETGLHAKMQPRIAAMVDPAEIADASHHHDERPTCYARAQPNRTSCGPFWLIGVRRKPEELFIGTR
jgi:hypothetical protein